jgi:hypothetical protein
MTAADLIHHHASRLDGLDIPADGIIGVYTYHEELSIQIFDAAIANRLADTIGDRAAMELRETTANGASVNHHRCPIRDRPNVFLVWCT